jgi:ATP-dependent helicase HrpA
LIDRYSHEIKEPAESSAVDSHWNQKGINSWDFGDLPEQVDIGKSGWPVINFPALVDKQESVSIQLFADKNAALAAHQAGVCRLIAIALGKSCKRYFQTPSISNSVALYLTQLEISSRQLGAEIGRAALRESFTEGRRSIRSKVDFEERLESCYGKLHAAHTARSRLVISVLNNALDLEEVVGLANLVEATQIDIFEQLAWLVFPGFAESVPGDVLEHYPRYMEACRIRIQRAQGNPNADLRKLDEFTPHWRKYLDFSALKHSPHHDKELLNQYRWLLEEFRVSLFAQELKTARPVSSKRLRKLWETIFVEKVEK